MSGFGFVSEAGADFILLFLALLKNIFLLFCWIRADTHCLESYKELSGLKKKQVV